MIDNTDTTVSSPLIEWRPLDGLTQCFANVGAEATSAYTLRAVGAAFLALADERRAYRSYQHAYRSARNPKPEAIARDLSEVLTSLHDAFKQWSTAALWVDALLTSDPFNKEAQQEAATLFPVMQEHQRYLWQLGLRMQTEYAAHVASAYLPAPEDEEQQEGQHTWP